MALYLGNSPFDPKRAKHRDIGVLVGGVGIKQGSVPIEQNNSRWEYALGHQRRIVAEERTLIGVVRRDWRNSWLDVANRNRVASSSIRSS